MEPVSQEILLKKILDNLYLYRSYFYLITLLLETSKGFNSRRDTLFKLHICFIHIFRSFYPDLISIIILLKLFSIHEKTCPHEENLLNSQSLHQLFYCRQVFAVVSKRYLKTMRINQWVQFLLFSRRGTTG